MGDTKTTAWQEITQGFGKVLVWLSYIVMGVIVKIAFESRTTKLTNKLIAIKVLLSVVAGAIASVACNTWGFEKWAMIIVPVCTLIGEGVFGYVIVNWSKVADFFLNVFLKSKSKK